LPEGGCTRTQEPGLPWKHLLRAQKHVLGKPKKKTQKVQQKLTAGIAVFSQLCVSRRSLQPLGHLFQTR
jgi:hypothetical protein